MMDNTRLPDPMDLDEVFHDEDEDDYESEEDFDLDDE